MGPWEAGDRLPQNKIRVQALVWRYRKGGGGCRLLHRCSTIGMIPPSEMFISRTLVLGARPLLLSCMNLGHDFHIADIGGHPWAAPRTSLPTPAVSNVDKPLCSPSLYFPKMTVQEKLYLFYRRGLHASKQDSVCPSHAAST